MVNQLITQKAGIRTYTLPAVADGKGKVFFFYSYVANNLVIAGASSILVGGSTSAGIVGATVTLTGVIGGWAVVIGDGTNYFVLAGTGTWTYST